MGIPGRTESWFYYKINNYIGSQISKFIVNIFEEPACTPWNGTVWDTQIYFGWLSSSLHWKGPCTVCDTTWKQNINWTRKMMKTLFQSITYIDLHCSIDLFHFDPCPKHTRPLQRCFLWRKKQSCSHSPLRKDPPLCSTLCVRWGQAWSSYCSPWRGKVWSKYVIFQNIITIIITMVRASLK